MLCLLLQLSDSYAQVESWTFLLQHCTLLNLLLRPVTTFNLFYIQTSCVLDLATYTTRLAWASPALLEKLDL